MPSAGGACSEASFITTSGACTAVLRPFSKTGTPLLPFTGQIVLDAPFAGEAEGWCGGGIAALQGGGPADWVGASGSSVIRLPAS